MESDDLQPWMRRELADVIVRPLSIIFERSWWLEEVHEDFEKANVTHSFKKGKQEDLGIRTRNNRHKLKHEILSKHKKTL